MLSQSCHKEGRITGDPVIPLTEGDFKRKLTEKQMPTVVHVTDRKESEG